MKMIYNFRWVIPGELAGSSRPFIEEDLRWLMDQGIKALVCLDELPMYQKDAARLGLDYVHIAVEDYNRPSLDQMVEFVKWVDDKRADGKAVNAYCDAGLGRTGCMLAGYLVSKGFKPDDAVIEVRKTNKQSIHTDVQMEAIYDFAKLLATQRSE